jgi:integrase
MASVTKFWMQRAGRWRLKCAISGQKDRYKILPADTTGGQAEGSRLAWLAEIEAGRGGPLPYSPRMHLGPFLSALADLQPHLAASTRARYAEFRRRIGPLLSKQLANITLSDAAELQRRLLAEGLHPNTVRHVYQHAHAGLAEAARLGVLSADPWRLARGVRAQRQDKSIPAPADIAQRIAQIPGRPGVLLRLAFASGCRRGELLALTWADIEGAALKISKGLEMDGDRVMVSPPKTGRSRRTVSLPAFASHELAALRLEAAANALAAGVDLGTLPVLPGDDGGWWHPRAATKASARALRRAGLPATLHTMRHAHATALLSGAVNPAEVQARLGHANMQTTLGAYGHALPHDDTRALAVMTATVEGGF